MRKRILNNQTSLERLLDIAAIVLLIISFVYILMKWSEMPNHIPMGFDSNGHVSQQGDKMSILGLPFIGILIWLLFSYMEKDPRNINLPLYRSNDQSKEQKYNRIIVNIIKNGIVISLIIENWRILFLVLS